MSKATLSQVMERIDIATEDSPIAVFQDVTGALSALFARTVMTARLIERSAPGFIGVFHKDMDRDAVYERIRAARV